MIDHWSLVIFNDRLKKSSRFLPLVDRTSQPEEMMLHSRDRCDVTALAAHKQCTEVNWTVNFNITGNRKMMEKCCIHSNSLIFHQSALNSKEKHCLLSHHD